MYLSELSRFFKDTSLCRFLRKVRITIFKSNRYTDGKIQLRTPLGRYDIVFPVSGWQTNIDRADEMMTLIEESFNFYAQTGLTPYEACAHYETFIKDIIATENQRNNAVITLNKLAESIQRLKITKK